MFTTGEGNVKGGHSPRSPGEPVRQRRGLSLPLRPDREYRRPGLKRPGLLYWATRIGGRYMGAEQADEYGRRNAVEGELLVTVAQQKILAYRGLAH